MKCGWCGYQKKGVNKISLCEPCFWVMQGLASLGEYVLERIEDNTPIDSDTIKALHKDHLHLHKIWSNNAFLINQIEKGDSYDEARDKLKDKLRETSEKEAGGVKN